MYIPVGSRLFLTLPPPKEETWRFDLKGPVEIISGSSRLIREHVGSRALASKVPPKTWL